MKRRRKKLKELQIRLAVHVDQPRTAAYDKLALEAANELSATPVKRFRFEGKTMSQLATTVEYLVYSARGIPKEEDQ